MYTNQQIENYKKMIQKIVKQNLFGYASILKYNIELLSFINFLTPKLQDKKYSIATKIYWILNDLTDFPICPICKKQYGMNLNINLNRGYAKTCSTKCGSISSRQKVLKTCIQKYGVDNPAKAEVIKEKSKNTCIQKYGSQHVNQFTNENLNQKYKSTCLQKYGVDNPNKNIDVRNKIKNTCIQKYGVDNPFKSEIIKEKIKNTCIQKYGVDNPNKLSDIRLKIKNTCIQKYGVDSPLKNDIIKEKRQNTLLKNYNVIAPMLSQQIKNNNIISKSIKQYKKIELSQSIKPLFNLEYFLQHKNDILFKYEWQCLKCNTKFESAINKNWHQINGEYARCQNCYPKLNTFSSYEEKTLVNFIKQNSTLDIIENTRKIIQPLQLDIYIPQKKLAFQFDGLYYHSEVNLENNNYHLIKTKQCLEKDIQLIHIFENEWLYKQNIVKSRIKNLLGIYDKVIYARKCVVKQISFKQAQSFLNDNHLQGSVKSKINLGLFYNDKLVSIMTFGKARYNKNYQWQLLRFCNKCNHHIPGAASKLLTYFERNFNPISIISYADRRWSNGNVYEKIGFKLLNISAPDYWYWKNIQFSHRSKYQKHRLKDIQNFKFDENLTESQNMLNNGYNRIFDCGNLVYIKNLL